VSRDILYGHLSYGQSLSIGAGGQPALSLRQPFHNLTFGAGPKTTLTGNGFGGRNQSDMDTTSPLVEDDLAPDRLSTRGETFCSSAVNGAVELARLENRIDPAEFVWFSSACGKGGEPIENLLKDAPPDRDEDPAANYYTNLLDHVERANAIAAGLGKE